MNTRVLVRGLLLIGSLMLVGLALQATHFGAALDQAWVDSEIRNQGVSGELVFILIGGLAIALAMPRQIVGFLGGYAFGLLAGTLLALVATVLGSLLVFSYARFIGRDAVSRYTGPRIERLNNFLRSAPFAMSMVVRLLPVGNNLATNTLAGLSAIPLLPFIAGSAVGFVPQTVVFVLLGSGVRVDPLLNSALAAVLFVAAGAAGVWLYRKYRPGRGDNCGLDLDSAEEPGSFSAELSVPPEPSRADRSE